MTDPSTALRRLALPPAPRPQPAPELDPVETVWRALAAEIVLRDGRRCRRCGLRRRLTVHHITPREHGGTEDPRNLLTLCGPCHDRIEVALAEGVPWVEIAGALAARVPNPPDVPQTLRAAVVLATAIQYRLVGAHWGSNGESGGVWGVDPRARVTFVRAETGRRTW